MLLAPNLMTSLRFFHGHLGVMRLLFISRRSFFRRSCSYNPPPTRHHFESQIFKKIFLPVSPSPPMTCAPSPHQLRYPAKTGRRRLEPERDFSCLRTLTITRNPPPSTNRTTTQIFAIPSLPLGKKRPFFAPPPNAQNRQKPTGKNASTTR